MLKDTKSVRKHRATGLKAQNFLGILRRVNEYDIKHFYILRERERIPFETDFLPKTQICDTVIQTGQKIGDGEATKISASALAGFRPIW
uniref:Uncharacterized protein n=1 Tax=Romanomermis culicivorax TaxID=13658 RepID=A0A915I9N0_ROMCU